LTYLLLFFSIGSQAQINDAVAQVLISTTPPDSLSSSNPDHTFCPGETVQLSVNGGLLGTNAQWSWFEEGCAVGTSFDTGSSIFVTPADTLSIYYCTATGGCNMPCASISMSMAVEDNSCIVLPLHLLSFNASLYKEKMGLLTWETSDEEKGTTFDLLKSRNGKDFINIYHLKAKATANNGSYSYVDENLKTGRNYYRLKITYPNQSVSYSLVRMIKYIPKEDAVNLYPNPTDGFVYFEFDGKDNQEVQVWISNIIGQSFQKRMVVYAMEGKNIVKMDLSDLSQGAYLFHYQNSNGKSEVLKFMKTN
jgi:hypothetical protein